VFSPDSKTAYVVSTGAGPKASVAAKVTPVSTVTGKAAPPIKLGLTAASLWAAIMPGGAKLYVSARWAGQNSGEGAGGNWACESITARRAPSTAPRPSRGRIRQGRRCWVGGLVALPAVCARPALLHEREAYAGTAPRRDNVTAGSHLA
jgi:hypothetical protein